MTSKGKPAYFDEQGRRYCTACQQMKTRENFSGQGKYAASLCKECKADKAMVARQLKIGERMQQAVGALQEHIGRGGKVPHTAELVEELMLACGGPKVLMQQFWNSMKEAEEGSLTALKYFDTAFKLVKDNVALGGAKKPLDVMEHDELLKHLSELMGPEAGIAQIDETAEEEDFDGDIHTLPQPEDDDGFSGAAAG